MKKINFKTIDKLADKMIDDLSKYDDGSIVAICKYDIVVTLIESLIKKGVEIFDYINIENDVNGYCSEYYLCLSDYGITVEKMYSDDLDDYLYGESEIAYYHSECNSKVISHNDSEIEYEFSIGNDDYYEIDYDEIIEESEEYPDYIVSIKTNCKIDDLINSYDRFHYLSRRFDKFFRF